MKTDKFTRNSANKPYATQIIPPRVGTVTSQTDNFQLLQCVSHQSSIAGCPNHSDPRRLHRFFQSLQRPTIPHTAAGMWMHHRYPYLRTVEPALRQPSYPNRPRRSRDFGLSRDSPLANFVMFALLPTSTAPPCLRWACNSSLLLWNLFSRNLAHAVVGIAAEFDGWLYKVG